MSLVQSRAPKAYQNDEFLQSPEARLLRMMSEYMEPRSRLWREKIRDTIVFFGSARLTSREEAVAKKQQVEHSAQVVERMRGSEEIVKELEATRRIADIRLQMSRYYEDAVEIARLLTEWSVHVAMSDYERDLKKQQDGKERLPFVSTEAVRSHSFRQRYVVCSGGGPGIMEAANKGATLAGGKSIGLNISLPYEQMPNSYITDELNFEFHYFFMRKFWFAYLCKAMMIFPGGYGTVDELFEILTLVQTNKIKKKMPIVVYGTDYWHKLINWELFAEYGLIDQADLSLIHFSDSPEDAFTYIKTKLERIDEGEETFMKSSPKE
jgi:uncharacterized protein (TIGR00730 family)